MSDLPLKEMKIQQAEKIDTSKYIISLKRDGTLMYYVDGNLISPRGINRNNRFPHIKKILDENKMVNCFGEMYIDNGNVFDVSSRENWSKAKYMPIDLIDKNLSYNERQNLMNHFVTQINDSSITPLIIFKTIEEGWGYVVKSDGEGLILRNQNEWYKVKRLIEAKIPIKSWESGSEKGTFILDNSSASRISGTSVGFVKQFHDIKNKGLIPMAEVEYPFETKDGKLFQPRLRRIYVQEHEKLIVNENDSLR